MSLLGGQWSSTKHNIAYLIIAWLTPRLWLKLPRPVASLLITGGSFSSDFGFFQGLKIGVPSGCFGKTSIFKIIMTDDITLVVKARIYMVKSTRFYGRTI